VIPSAVSVKLLRSFKYYQHTYKHWHDIFPQLFGGKHQLKKLPPWNRAQYSGNWWTLHRHTCIIFGLLKLHTQFFPFLEAVFIWMPCWAIREFPISCPNQFFVLVAKLVSKFVIFVISVLKSSLLCCVTKMPHTKRPYWYPHYDVPISESISAPQKIISSCSSYTFTWRSSFKLRCTFIRATLLLRKITHDMYSSRLLTDNSVRTLRSGLENVSRFY